MFLEQSTGESYTAFCVVSLFPCLLLLLLLPGSRCCLDVSVLVLTYIHPDCHRAVSLALTATTIFHIMRTRSDSLEIFFLLASKKKNRWRKKVFFRMENMGKKERYTRTNTLLQIPFSFFNGREKKYFPGLSVSARVWWMFLWNFEFLLFFWLRNFKKIFHFIQLSWTPPSIIWSWKETSNWYWRHEILVSGLKWKEEKSLFTARFLSWVRISSQEKFHSCRWGWLKLYRNFALRIMKILCMTNESNLRRSWRRSWRFWRC